MKRLLKKMLLDKGYKINYDNFNYEFNEKSSELEFIEEFQNFLGMINAFYYNGKYLVTSINSQNVILKKETLNHFLKLYQYAKQKGKELEQQIISEFLWTYQNTIRSKDYIYSVGNAKQIREEFTKIVKEVFNDNRVLEDESFHLYNKVIDYATINHKTLNSNDIAKIINNININKNNKKLIIDKLIKKQDCLYDIINYDSEIKKHCKDYLEKSKNYLNNNHEEKYANKIIDRLIAKKILKGKSRKEIVNIYIDKCNKLCNEILQKKRPFINVISDVENLRQSIVELLKNKTFFLKREQKKLQECLVRLLSVKRYCMKDKKYIELKGEKIESPIVINKQKWKSIIQEIKKNPIQLCNLSYMDFSLLLEASIRNYAEHPLDFTFSNFLIDGQKQSYYYEIEKSTNNISNIFKKHYDIIGKEYTDKHPEFQNILDKDYYENMLKYSLNIFRIWQEMVEHIIGKKNYQDALNGLISHIKIPTNNKYIILVHNILHIEELMKEILISKGIKVGNGIHNLYKIAEMYTADNDIMNQLMYLYYVLYEISGMNLRNMTFHGELISEQLNIPLLTSFTGLMIISSIAKKNNVNEESSIINGYITSDSVIIEGNIISTVETPETIQMIGKIDTLVLDNEDIYSLYYIFPLIERLIREIYRLIPESDFEHFESDIPRTIISIIENNKHLNVLPEDLIEKINKYYQPNGARNRLLHPELPNNIGTISFNELKVIIIDLLSVLKSNIKNIDEKQNLDKNVSKL